jgi:hypothetical protein
MKRMLIALLVLGACTPQDAPTQEAATPDTSAASTQPTMQADEIPAPEGQLMVTSPGPEAQVSSPLVVEGFVQNDWMFEGVFPVTLEVDGATVAEAPGEQQAPDNWTNPGPVKFRAELMFTVDKETAATLVFKEDMPAPVSADSDVAGPARTLRIPVTLMPPTP